MILIGDPVFKIVAKDLSRKTSFKHLSSIFQIYGDPPHGLKRGARDVSTAAKLELQLDFSRTLLILARDGSLKKLLLKIYVYGIEPPGASPSISFQAMVFAQKSQC